MSGECVKRKKVLFIAYVFPPISGSGVQRSLKFIKYLRNYGWEPVVVTVGDTKAAFFDETLFSDIPEGIEIIRINRPGIIDDFYVNELFNVYSKIVPVNILNEYISIINKYKLINLNWLLLPDVHIPWANEVIKEIHKYCNFDEIDLIYSTSGPYSDHIIGYYLKKEYNKPWVADFRDEWTNNPMIKPNKKNIVYIVLREMEKKIVEFADKIITTTDGAASNYKKIFNLKDDKVVTITNGYDEEDFKEISLGKNKSNNKDNEKDQNKRFTIIHNGVLYGNRSPIPFINVIKNLVDGNKISKDKIVVYFAYTDKDEEYKAYIKERGLGECIQFSGYLSHKESLKKASNADLLLLIIGEEEKWKTVHAGKVFEYLRLCKPIMGLSPKGSVTEELLTETGRGKNFDFSDYEGMESYILEIYEKWQEDKLNACILKDYKINEDIIKFERKNLTKKLADVFNELIHHKKFLESIKNKIKEKKAIIGIIGLGYVGLPLALTFAESGYRVIGFDKDEKKIVKINEEKVSYIKHIHDSRVKNSVENGRLFATSDLSKVENLDAIILCLPTPLNKYREPDLSFVINSVNGILPFLKKGQLISLESTTYPGTTEEEIIPKIEKRGFKIGKDFFVVYSPEREDPGNLNFTTKTVPKVVGGATKTCLEIGVSLYESVIEEVVPVNSLKAAELTKLLENIYRAVNIGLVNEMKIVADKMGIDIWEVIKAASTKPFGFTPFYPGPGLGGHCIPIDPFYLTWKAKEYGICTKFIELAGEVNTMMPFWVVDKVVEGLNNSEKSLKNSNILVLGLSYKKNIDDTRESPSVELIKILKSKGANVFFSDPYIKKFPKKRKCFFDLESIEITAENLEKMDCVLISTDHDAFDFDFILRHSKLIVDTRGVYRGSYENVIKA
jgi:UDP-N-acetyl-D-glucosamine dehydrogenase